MIQQTSPGVDGQQYSLQFSAEIPDMDIPSYDLPFLFYNGLFFIVSIFVVFQLSFVIVVAVKYFDARNNLCFTC